MTRKLFYYSIQCKEFGSDKEAVLYLNSMDNISTESDSSVLYRLLEQLRDYVPFDIHLISVERLREEKLLRSNRD